MIESEVSDYDETICDAQDEVNQGEWTECGWRNEEGSWFHR